MDNACKLFDHINIAKSNCVCHFLVSRNYRHVTFAKEKWAFCYYFETKLDFNDRKCTREGNVPSRCRYNNLDNITNLS